MKERRTILFNGKPTNHLYINGMAVLEIGKLRKQLESKSSNVRARVKAKWAVLERDFFQCVRCGSTDNLTIDHVEYDKNRLNIHSSPKDYKLKQCCTLCVFCHKEKNARKGVVTLSCARCARSVEFNPKHAPGDGVVFCPACRAENREWRVVARKVIR